MSLVLALDQGTSSSRALVFGPNGAIVSAAQQPFAQHYPQPGWVEHDPLEIWATQLATAQQALSLAGSAVETIGITNQRETTVLWDRASGAPLMNAIVWQDRRTEPMCARLRAAGYEPAILRATGLRLDAYFSATKLAWMLDHIPGARARAQAGELAFGTIDSWLIWQLTRGGAHVTDVTNASRTSLLNLHTGDWDDALLALFDIPRAVLPKVVSSSGEIALSHPDVLGRAIPIRGVAGDQQAALVGQGCVADGQVKNTYGTGCFMLMHTGATAVESANGLLTTRAAGCGAQPAFALEGSVFMGGAVVQWLRDELRVIRSSSEIEALAASVPDTAGVVMVPAFVGLGAPYWRADARASIQGLSRGSNVAHIARAALESIALQSAALLFAMERDRGAKVASLRVDGGACVNDLLMQMQADVLGIPVERVAVLETTALGAAKLAGLSLEALPIGRVFEPQASGDWAAEKFAAWEAAVKRSGGDTAQP